VEGIKGCHSCCSAGLANGNGKTASKEVAIKLDTQLSFQAPLPEEWRMWCGASFLIKKSCIVFDEERANLNAAITLDWNCPPGMYFRY